jgi:hypothetical protein
VSQNSFCLFRRAGHESSTDAVGGERRRTVTGFVVDVYGTVTRFNQSVTPISSSQCASEPSLEGFNDQGSPQAYMKFDESPLYIGRRVSLLRT